MGSRVQLPRLPQQSFSRLARWQLRSLAFGLFRLLMPPLPFSGLSNGHRKLSLVSLRQDGFQEKFRSIISSRPSGSMTAANLSHSDHLLKKERSAALRICRMATFSNAGHRSIEAGQLEVADMGPLVILLCQRSWRHAIP
jgi:hypothetical protein